jgi:hypothetical protein
MVLPGECLPDLTGRVINEHVPGGRVGLPLAQPGVQHEAQQYGARENPVDHRDPALGPQHPDYPAPGRSGLCPTPARTSPRWSPPSRRSRARSAAADTGPPAPPWTAPAGRQPAPRTRSRSAAGPGAGQRQREESPPMGRTASRFGSGSERTTKRHITMTRGTIWLGKAACGRWSGAARGQCQPHDECRHQARPAQLHPPRMRLDDERTVKSPVPGSPLGSVWNGMPEPAVMHVYLQLGRSNEQC